MKFTVEIEVRDPDTPSRSVQILVPGDYHDGMGMASMSGACLSEDAIREVLHNLSDGIAFEIGKAITKK